jgi:hypothetical protein
MPMTSENLKNIRAVMSAKSREENVATENAGECKIVGLAPPNEWPETVDMGGMTADHFKTVLVPHDQVVDYVVPADSQPTRNRRRVWTEWTLVWVIVGYFAGLFVGHFLLVRK